MNATELHDYIACHSDDSAVLAFFDKGNPETHFTDANRRYRLDERVMGKTVALAIIPDDEDGDYLHRSRFLSKLERIAGTQRKTEAKCQIILTDQSAEHPLGFLTDDMWSHITATGGNSFCLDNPVPLDDIDKGVLSHLGRTFTSNIASGHFF